MKKIIPLALCILLFSCSQKRTAYFFGDSITFGSRVEKKDRWSTILCMANGWTEKNLGIRSATLEKRTPENPLGNEATNMVDRIGEIPQKSVADTLIFFSFGNNDIGYTGENYNVENFKTDYQSVINAALSKGWHSYNLVLFTSYYMDTVGYNFYHSKFNITAPDSSRQQSFNNAIKEIGKINNIKVIDVYNALKNAGGDAMLVDGVHPNKDGHKVVYSQIK